MWCSIKYRHEVQRGCLGEISDIINWPRVVWAGRRIAYFYYTTRSMDILPVLYSNRSLLKFDWSCLEVKPEYFRDLGRVRLAPRFKCGAIDGKVIFWITIKLNSFLIRRFPAKVFLYILNGNKYTTEPPRIVNETLRKS